MKKRILVLGGSGLVGSSFIASAKDQFDISYTYNENPQNFGNTKSYKVNFLTELEKISSIIAEDNPHVILHTVASPSVDLCETNHDLADTLHVTATKKIIYAAKKINAKVIFLSTDAVFDGTSNKKYSENDIPKPVNYYGVTKLNAEKIVLEEQKNVVLRTAVIYGWHKKSRFTGWIISYLSEKKSVDPFSDQFNTPTLVDDLVLAIIKIIQSDVSGLFHAVGKTCCSRYDIALLLADIFNLKKNLIKPVTSKEKKQDAPRPFKTCLDASKLEQSINFDFCDLEHGISKLFKKSKI